MSETTTRLMTVEEFRQLPETGPFYYELRHGELVEVPRPKSGIYKLERRLRQLLEGPAGNAGIVDTDLAFRALPEYEMRVAEVAFVSKERWRQVDLDDNLRGAPELVIEVPSPSHTMNDLLDKEKLCLENGCREFWVVDSVHRIVKISTPDGLTKAYREGQEIPLQLFPGSLPVKSIFSE
jgi:Uma2 family endonuclease